MALVPPPKVNELIQCPYDKAHQILKTRIQTHLIKCRKNFKNAEKETCPFNSTHIINKQEMEYHVKICDDRATLDRFKYNIVEPKMPCHDLDENITPIPNEQEQHLDPTDEWSNIYVPTYNPQRYCKNAPVLRMKIGGTRSENKAFKRSEHERLRKLQ